jgi:hypothetical protein
MMGSVSGAGKLRILFDGVAIIAFLVSLRRVHFLDTPRSISAL